eukprot:4454579-Lingulodinium_polyedra.AAC.1
MFWQRSGDGRAMVGHDRVMVGQCCPSQSPLRIVCRVIEAPHLAKKRSARYVPGAGGFCGA